MSSVFFPLDSLKRNFLASGGLAVPSLAGRTYGNSLGREVGVRSVFFSISF